MPVSEWMGMRAIDKRPRPHLLESFEHINRPLRLPLQLAYDRTCHINRKATD